jgi:putative cell wall-binding protein
LHVRTRSALVMVAALLAALTHVGGAGAQGGEGLIAFTERYDPDTPLERVDVMAPDGSGRRTVVDDAASPALSPDGSSIAFERDGDIWVADVATGQAQPVAAGPTFESDPAWSPDGSLLAFSRGTPAGADCTHLTNSDIVITDFSGETPVTATDCLVEGGVDFSPDGGSIAYHSLYRNADFSGGVSIITTHDLRTGASELITDPGQDGLAFNPAWSPDGALIAYEGTSSMSTVPAGGGTSTAIIRFDSLPEDCGSPADPDWSPDGEEIALGLLCDDGDIIATIPSTGGPISRITGPGGSAGDPSWASTAAAPGPGPGPTPPPSGRGSTPPQPDEPLLPLEDGLRVDGGGATDPVGQAIATAQVWADDGAGLVVLATADRFPDALAGSALAGELGPILLTPFGDDLDARVAAEIDRVLPDDGIVLVLGGVNAVSESAAAQARAAAGSTSCPDPFPADCRYAGSGREQTAALVGQTVLELNGGSGGRALLARGDVFADAITGGAYAAEAGVPILLTPSGTLNADTERFITDNGIGEVIVLGGTAAVSDPVVAAIPTQTRRIAGDDRTATAAAIATGLWQAEGLAGGGIVLVNVRHDDGWQTALAASVISAVANAPQLGVENPPADPSPATTQAAAVLGGPVETYGSADLVSDAQIQAVQQAAG